MIILVTFVGGLGPGLLAVGLATLVAGFMFLPPDFSWTLGSAEIFSLAVFALMSLVNVAVVAFLDKALDRVEAEERHVRLLIETSPNGILVVNEAGQITLVNPSDRATFWLQAGRTHWAPGRGARGRGIRGESRILASLIQ